MEGEDNIDYERWYRELFKKFTTIRDAMELYDEIDMSSLFLFVQNILKDIKGLRDKEKYEAASNLINGLFHKKVLN
jgi:hypothetical protein